MQNIVTHDSLPEAVSRLFDRLDNIEKLLELKTTPSAPDEFLDINEAGDLIRLTPASIYGLVSRREIPHNKKGNRLYFLKSELLQWMQEGRRRTIKEIQETA